MTGWPLERKNIPANTSWADEIGYSRAVRVGPLVMVSQTSSVDPSGVIAGGSDPYAQAVHALRNVTAALNAAGAGAEDVIRIRIYVARFQDWREVARAHAELFHDIRPAISLIACPMVSDGILVEFEADAVVGLATPIAPRAESAPTSSR